MVSKRRRRRRTKRWKEEKERQGGGRASPRVSRALRSRSELGGNDEVSTANREKRGNEREEAV